jgi:hypothetical protein
LKMVLFIILLFPELSKAIPCPVWLKTVFLKILQ